MKLIPLTKGKFANVDDEDYEWLNQWTWCIRNGYASRTYKLSGKDYSIYMHRLIANTPLGMETDHIDRNKLNNQRINLRKCSATENLQNSRKHKDNKSGYKGVSYHNQCGKWTARIKANGIYKHIGLFANPEEAAHAYDEAARKYYGEFARTNF